MDRHLARRLRRAVQHLAVEIDDQHALRRQLRARIRVRLDDERVRARHARGDMSAVVEDAEHVEQPRRCRNLDGEAINIRVERRDFGAWLGLQHELRSLKRPLRRQRAAFCDFVRLSHHGQTPDMSFVVAVDHLHRAAEAVLGILQPQRARLGAVLLRQPDALMAPHARTFLALERLPFVDIDRARAPAVLDHEGGGRPASRTR